MNETKETVGQVLDLLLGDANGENGRLTGAVREQIMPQIEQRVAGMEESIAVLREAAAKGPPAQEKTLYSAPPWKSAAAALGLPDPNWYNPEAPGAALDGKFAGFGDFVKAVIRRDIGKISDDRLVSVTKGTSAALTGEEIELGGALVPEEFRPQLLSGMVDGGNFRPRAMVLPMGSGSLSVPAIRDSDHSDGSTGGGIKFQWTEQAATIGESQPAFKLIELNARTLSGRTELPNQLLSDSFQTVPALLMRLYQEHVPWVEDGVFYRGDGVAKPKGILDAPATVSVSRATANQISTADLATMVSHLPPGSAGRAVWVMHPQVLPQIFTLNEGSVQSFHPRTAEAMPDMFNGRPIIWSEHCSGLGAKGDVALIDWMYYLIGDRQALSMDASPHEKFSNYMTVVRAVERIDGTPWIDTAIIPAQRSGTDYKMSPFVVLNVP